MCQHFETTYVAKRFILSSCISYVFTRQGAKSPQPVDGITGYECPRGTYCPAGSSFPIGCPPGSYNPSEAMEVCATCTAGSICPGNSTAPEECPIYHYCPAGSAAGITCPAGTYGSRVRTRSPSYYNNTIDHQTGQ